MDFLLEWRAAIVSFRARRGVPRIISAPWDDAAMSAEIPLSSE